jgi:hypothetical protein
MEGSKQAVQDEREREKENNTMCHYDEFPPNFK